MNDWADNVNSRRPERVKVFQHIAGQIRSLTQDSPCVVELGLGPGMLAEVLLTKVPHLGYIGIDFSEPMLALARKRLARFGIRVSLHQADLNEADWPELLPGENHAVVSMQALHDLGDEIKLDRIYGMVRDLLVPGGLFLNADLVVPPTKENPQKPGRRSVQRHLELLRSHDYERVACTLELEDFACCVAYAPQPQG